MKFMFFWSLCSMVKAEWTLVTLAWNMKRMFALKAA